MKGGAEAAGFAPLDPGDIPGWGEGPDNAIWTDPLVAVSADAEASQERGEGLQPHVRSSLLGRWLRRGLIAVACGIVVLGYGALADLQLTLNGSESLPETAYLQWHWPKVYWHGAVVAVPPPAIFGDKLDGYSIVKKVGGMPGDPIRNFGDQVCVAGTCYAAEMRDGRAFAELLPSGTVPEGMLAVFGEAPNSLDSRYQTFGFVPMADVEAVGVPFPGFPSWQEVATWLGQEW